MNAITRLSDKAQVVVPEAIRDLEDGAASLDLEAIDAGDGVLLGPRRRTKTLTPTGGGGALRGDLPASGAAHLAEGDGRGNRRRSRAPRRATVTIAVDTNVVLRWITRDDPVRCALADPIFDNPVMITTTVLLGTEWVLRGRRNAMRRDIIASCSGKSPRPRP
jgi:hypothetical protein